jgi:hypothetical protein
MKKSLITILIALFCTIQAQAFDFEANGIYYNFIHSTSSVEVTRFIDYRGDDFNGKGDYHGDIIIPSTAAYEGKEYHVVRIGKQAFRESVITSVTIPASVNSIGYKAFASCSSLKKIELRWDTPLPVNWRFEEDLNLTFDGTNTSRITLIVPANTQELYAAAPVWNDFYEIKESDWDASSVGVVEYQGVKYKNCHAEFFDIDDEQVYMAITQNSGAAPFELAAFELYFTLKKNNRLFPAGYFRYDAAEPAANGAIVAAGFVRIYTDWSAAQHQYPGKQATVYIQPLGENRYTIAGQITLDNPANDTVDFVLSGGINYVSPEVMSISAYFPDDYKNSSGFMTVENKKIKTPFVYHTWEKGRAKIYLLDRVLLFDKKLEYGVSFELEPRHTIYGIFVYNKNMSIEDDVTICRPAFFNKHRTEYPDEATLTITETKYQEYKVDYTLKFSDNRIVKGSYKGKIPKRDR